MPPDTKGTAMDLLHSAADTVSSAMTSTTHSITGNPPALQSIAHPQLVRDSDKLSTHDSHRNAGTSGYHGHPSDGKGEGSIENGPPVDFAEFLERYDRNVSAKDRARLGREFVPESRFGWYGYIDWENNPEMTAKAEAEFARHKFTGQPEFQTVPLPSTNPILLGHRWKEYHHALGPNLERMSQESWSIVKEEKADEMLHVLDFPNNCEPPRKKLMENHITANEIHYVRNHGGIPTVQDESLYSFSVGGLVGREGRLTLDQLRDPELFEQREVPTTLQCSGTRRIEQIDLYPGLGDELLSAPWAEGAIGTAVYKGVTLKSVLDYFGGAKREGQHVEVIGADTYFKKGKLSNYAVSIPYRKARHEDVLLAYEMNGKPLPRVHGAPLRLVVPGFIGARSTKWVVAINVLAEPSMGSVQRQEYLYWSSQIGKHNETPSNGVSIQAMPTSSALMSPTDKQVVIHDGHIRCSGWAYTGGTDTWVERVEVSCDGGFVWYEVPHENMSPKYYGCMRLWQFDMPVQSEGWLEIVVRAWDDALKGQPTYVRSAWQWGLHITSSAHRVPIYSVNRSRPATSARLALFEQNGEPFEPLTKPTPFPVQTPAEYEAAMRVKGGREPEPFVGVGRGLLGDGRP